MATSASGTAAPVPSLNSWTLNFETDTEEVTSFGDANKTYVQGLADVTMDFGGFWDDTDTILKAAAASTDGAKIYVYPSTNAPTKYAYGVAWVNYSLEGSVDGAVSVSGSAAAAGSWGNNL